MLGMMLDQSGIADVAHKLFLPREMVVGVVHQGLEYQLYEFRASFTVRGGYQFADHIEYSFVVGHSTRLNGINT